MSIAGVVKQVYHNEDGGGRMLLGPNPRNGDSPGQPELSWDSGTPHDVTALHGCVVWGGAGFLMLGETQIATRIGYTRIEWDVKEIGRLAAGQQKHPFGPEAK